MFALGYIAGVATCAFLFVVITTLRIDRVAEEMTIALRRKGIEIAQKLPPAIAPIVRGQGFVSVPEDDDEAARKEIIEENSKKGRSTPVADLRS